MAWRASLIVAGLVGDVLADQPACGAWRSSRAQAPQYSAMTGCHRIPTSGCSATTVWPAASGQVTAPSRPAP
jgi:hypothetical protein